jgi:N-acetylneuraminic acid mutarotase
LQIQWNTKTPRPNENLRDPSSVVLDDKIYVIGGDSIINYDPKTDTWITLTPIPTPRGKHSVAVYQNKIYCISGYVDYNEAVRPLYRYLDTVEVYDPVEDSWSKKAPVPIKVKLGSPFIDTPIQACVVNDQLFAIGSKGELYLYNPSTDRWSRKTTLSAEATYR